jgi:hypothetical protein
VSELRPLRPIADTVFAGGLVLAAMTGAAVTYLSIRVPRAPLAPDAGRGLVYPANNHGVIHYVSWADHLIGEVFFPLAVLVLMALLAVSAIVGVGTGLARRVGPSPPP